MNGNNFNGPGTGLNERLGINERPLDLLSYNNGLFRALDKQAVIESPEKSKPEPGPDEKNYFYVENLGNSDINFFVQCYVSSSGYIPNMPFEVSTNRETWTTINEYTNDGGMYKSTFTTIPAGEKLYIRCVTNSWKIDNDYYYYNIATENHNDEFNVGGNIMSLLYGDDFEDKTSFPENSEYNFYNLFVEGGYGVGYRVVDASNLILPATTLTNSCYMEMFSSCTSLTSAPELPAMNLAESCYSSMFINCTSLTSAPELNATALAEYCYNNMFSGCISLTNAPELNATTLAPGCYGYMFTGCSRLETVKVHAQDISAKGCTDSWLADVAQIGTFYNLGGATYERSASGIPEGWTEETEKPQE